MKLLFCPNCWDIFKLDYKKRSCLCGKAIGYYTDDSNAVVNGHGISMGISNNILFLLTQTKITTPIKVTAFARPHEGITNPHTTVNPSLKRRKE